MNSMSQYHCSANTIMARPYVIRSEDTVLPILNVAEKSAVYKMVKEHVQSIRQPLGRSPVSSKP